MKILRFLTNKVVLVAFFSLLLVVSAWWIVRENAPRDVPFADKERGNQAELTASLQGTLIAKQAREDADGDGLYDWEEELWGTDPENPDSDGDGTEDGAEVAADRHPARPAPGDALPQGSAVTLQESIDAYLADESRTKTEKVALELFRGYADLRGKGAVGSVNEDALIKKLIAEQVGATRPERMYRTSELTLVADTSENRTAYKAQYDDMAAGLSTVEENELLTLQRALQSERESDIAKLDVPIAVYTDTIERLLTASVPREAAPLHVSLLNDFSLLRDALEDMRVSLDDPIRGVSAIQTYLTSVEQLTVSFSNLQSYFERYDLTENTS